jgi:hypothetical protein
LADAPPSDEHLPVLQRALLWATYAPPLTWWPVTSRLLGVRIDAAHFVDEGLLRVAERDSRVATKWMLWLLTWAVFVVATLKLWVLLAIVAGLAAESASPFDLGAFPGQSPVFWVAAAAVLVAVWAPTFVLGRLSVLATRSGISVALSLAASDESPDLSGFPRMAFVLPVLVPRMRQS